MIVRRRILLAYEQSVLSNSVVALHSFQQNAPSVVEHPLALSLVIELETRQNRKGSFVIYIIMLSPAFEASFIWNV